MTLQTSMRCRHCMAPLEHVFADLASSPPSNAFLSDSAMSVPEVWYPLRVLVCTRCWLVQTEDYAGREALFTNDYAYFSSYSSSWLAHAERYANAMMTRYAITTDSMVVEIAANDGYLLQYFKMRGIPCYGVEPTSSTANVARGKGIEVVEDFFGVSLANQLVAEGKQADLIVANNVLAHVPDINDFVAGFTRLLKPDGFATFEFPHLQRLVEGNQFDTIYHEHYSYLSLTAVQTILLANGLEIFEVEELSTHGGSLRVFCCRRDGIAREKSQNLEALLKIEQRIGITAVPFYRDFQQRVIAAKNYLLHFLLKAHAEKKTVGAYGAAAKGNTFLNYAGVRSDLLSWVADRNPAKQGRYMPGSRIPIVPEETIRHSRPDYILILPWNLKDEVQQQLSYIRDWDGRFIVAIPELVVF